VIVLNHVLDMNYNHCRFSSLQDWKSICDHLEDKEILHFTTTIMRPMQHVVTYMTKGVLHEACMMVVF